MPKDAQGRHLPRKGGGFGEFLVILLIAFALVFGFVRPFVIEAFYIPSKSMVPTLEVGDRVFVNKFIYRFHEPKRDDISVQDGVLFVNGERQEESYVNPRLPDTSSFAPMTVPKGEVFLMGDNRADSRDSRFFGAVPFENIEGKAFIIFWPPGHIKPI